MRITGDEVDHSKEYFKAHENGMAGTTPYVRKIPAHFSGEGSNDDIFMKSMHENYALEGKNKDGTPNGVFWMDRSAASSAAMEVMANNLKWSSEKISDQIATYFEKAWGHFDVNKTGYIKADRMAQFMSFLAGEPFIAGLHAQTK